MSDHNQPNAPATERDLFFKEKTMIKNTPLTKVEVIEERHPNQPENAPLIRINKVLINGKEVRVAKDGIWIDYDHNLETSNELPGGVVAVTVELLVDEFSIRQVPNGYTDGISEWEVELLAEQQRKVDQVVEHFEDGHIRFKTKPEQPRDAKGRFTKRKDTE